MQLCLLVAYASSLALVPLTRAPQTTGAVVTGFAEYVDIFPTLVELAGIPKLVPRCRYLYYRPHVKL